MSLHQRNLLGGMKQVGTVMTRFCAGGKHRRKSRLSEDILRWSGKWQRLLKMCIFLKISAVGRYSTGWNTCSASRNSRFSPQHCTMMPLPTETSPCGLKIKSRMPHNFKQPWRKWSKLSKTDKTQDLLQKYLTKKENIVHGIRRVR